MKTHPSTYAQLVGRILAEGGFTHAEDAERTAWFVLEAARERLCDAEAAAIARDLPSRFAAALEAGVYRADFEPEDLYARVHLRAGISRSAAVEQTQLVLRAVGDALSDDSRALLEHALPADWTELFFGAREFGEAPPYAAPRTGEQVRLTLSTARPGYRRPLVELDGELAHLHSIARANAPHAERKLSSGHPHTRRDR